ncbi:aldose 1-epimerase [Entomobacter blattae]|uniref:Aldose 1-epimerase n=1 Tax=Entomobacter blattae TaxID=2762277 RepID=A0A7H1NRS6_9PROT|nr:aldose 1-epimerase [Entomobacter blattae]QNT78486.1 putative protein YphB [Entomobacter blattae]
MLELKSGGSVLSLLPELGGAITFWKYDGDDVFYPTIDPRLKAFKGKAVSAYPLVPFSNRIANGSFTFMGTSYKLAPNFGEEPHTIHGNGWMRPWDLFMVEDHSATLMLDYQAPEGQETEWPFSYRAELVYTLHDNELKISLVLKNTDNVEQPVGIGFHPCFPRGKDLHLGFVAQGVWSRTPQGLPDKRVKVEGPLSFEPMRPIGNAALDHCYDGRNTGIFMRWPSIHRSLTISVKGPMTHLMVYTPENSPYITVEPISHMPDAINHPEVAGRGLVVLPPGGEVRGQITFSLSTF